MRLISILLMMCFLSLTAWADHASDERQFQQQLDNQPALPSPPELASQSVDVQIPAVYAAAKGKNTKATARFVNKDSNGHVVIAAYTPDATQVQLRTVVKVSGKSLDVKIHSFSLPLKSKTWLGLSQKHFALIGLKHDLQAGTTIPLTIIYRDGSYETVQATVKS